MRPIFILAALATIGCTTAPKPNAPARLTATIIDSGFADAHDTYNGISCASDGRIYYVLSSGKADLAAQMYVYDPKTNAVKHLGDLTEATGEKGSSAIAQGKSHVGFAESNGKLYFATHLGFYSIIDGMEKTSRPGHEAYRGGFLATTSPPANSNPRRRARNEGIITFAMDTQRQRLYGLTGPPAA